MPLQAAFGPGFFPCCPRILGSPWKVGLQEFKCQRPQNKLTWSLLWIRKLLKNGRRQEGYQARWWRPSMQCNRVLTRQTLLSWAFIGTSTQWGRSWLMISTHWIGCGYLQSEENSTWYFQRWHWFLGGTSFLPKLKTMADWESILSLDTNAKPGLRAGHFFQTA
jgi:hypothetical protein